jgi:uncharacterized FAD-dependent dehydrogenase
MTIETDIIIIGGGPSGLFLANELKSEGSSHFYLIEKDSANLGGLASLDYMKIGLLPAGAKTAEWLNYKRYEKFAEQFLNTYHDKLKEVGKESLGTKVLNPKLSRKYYESLLLPKEEFKSIIDNLKNKLSDQILFDTVTSINKENELFRVTLYSGKEIFCKKLIVASGRNDSVSCELEKNGEQFSRLNNMYFGCRACFEPTNADKLYLDQVDFRVSNPNGFQTYCFNYNGTIQELKYNGNKYYSGTLTPGSTVGNVFIGKRMRLSSEEVLKLRGISPRDKNGQFSNGFLGPKYKKYFEQLTDFVGELESEYNLKFTELLFPALEQFWARPILQQNS